GDLTGALPLYERALAIYEKALGPEHPNSNRARSNQARLLLMSRQPTEALSLGQTALAAHDKALGRNHTWTKGSARVTADALDALAAPMRRRRCGNGMGSRPLRTLSPHPLQNEFSHPDWALSPLTVSAQAKTKLAGKNAQPDLVPSPTSTNATPALAIVL